MNKKGMEAMLDFLGGALLISVIALGAFLMLVFVKPSTQTAEDSFDSLDVTILLQNWIERPTQTGEKPIEHLQKLNFVQNSETIEQNAKEAFSTNNELKSWRLEARNVPKSKKSDSTRIIIAKQNCERNEEAIIMAEQTITHITGKKMQIMLSNCNTRTAISTGNQQNMQN